jgi:hypothetical protein
LKIGLQLAALCGWCMGETVRPSGAGSSLPSIEDGLPAPGPALRRPAHDGAARLRELIAGLVPGYNARQMTYDLRRLRRKGFIQRIPAPTDTS